MPKVALVFSYFRTRSLTEMLFPPLGLANLTSQLRRLGIDWRFTSRHLRGAFRPNPELKVNNPIIHYNEEELETFRPLTGETSITPLTRKHGWRPTGRRQHPSRAHITLRDVGMQLVKDLNHPLESSLVIGLLERIKDVGADLFLDGGSNQLVAHSQVLYGLRCGRIFAVEHFIRHGSHLLC